MVAGLSDLTTATLPLAAIAVIMVALDLYVLDRLLRAYPQPPLSTFVLGGGTLIAQLVFWIGVAYYLFVPTVGGFVLFAIAVQFMMVPVGLWFVSLILQQSRQSIAPYARSVAVTLGVLVFANEYLMSVAFLPLAPPAFAGALSLSGNGVEFVTAPLLTVWYCWPMGVTMTALLVWARRPSADARAIATLTATAFVAPWVAEEPLAGAIAMMALMAFGLVLLVRSTIGETSATSHSATSRLGVAAGFALMSAGAFVSFLIPSGPGHVLPFASASAAVMLGETTYLIHGLLAPPPSLPTPAPIASGVAGVEA